MSAIVLYFAPAVPARLNRHANVAERLRLSLGVVEEAVVGGVQATRDRHQHLQPDSNPVAEGQAPLRHVRPQEYVPSGQVVQEERAARLDDPDALVNPTL